MAARFLAAGCAVLLVACAGVATEPTGASAGPRPTTTTEAGPPTTVHDGEESGTARLLFVGDTMLGRGVAPVAEAEGVDLFREVRTVVRDADVAAANLESPLTGRAHVTDNPNRLEADPALAEILAASGFDVLSLANNHSGDAGADGIVDTLDALEGAGVVAIGAARDHSAAHTPHVVEIHGLRIAFLAFDVTGLGLAASDANPGVARYEAITAQRAVAAAAAEADIVAVSVHGGLEYSLATDPVLEDVADALVGWGADVVWGHGGHVPQPVEVGAGHDGRTAVVATGLGNFLFDQQRDLTQTGLVLEVLVSADGVIAHRVGRAEHSDLRPRFIGWDLVEGDAVSFAGSWWTLVSPPSAAAAVDVQVEGFTMGDVTTAALGDATGDGVDDLVVSYRHPFRSNSVNELYPDHDFVDAEGRSAHLGVFEPGSLRPVWAAGTLLRPVREIAVCDGSLALAFDELDDAGIVATGAWTWWDFGFAVADELPGGGTPSCADVDGDGLTEPVIARRDAESR